MQAAGYAQFEKVWAWQVLGQQVWAKDIGKIEEKLGELKKKES